MPLIKTADEFEEALTKYAVDTEPGKMRTTIFMVRDISRILDTHIKDGFQTDFSTSLAIVCTSLSASLLSRVCCLIKEGAEVEAAQHLGKLLTKLLVEQMTLFAKERQEAKMQDSGGA
jgi:hypothetical protein